MGVPLPPPHHRCTVYISTQYRHSSYTWSVCLEWWIQWLLYCGSQFQPMLLEMEGYNINTTSIINSHTSPPSQNQQVSVTLEAIYVSSVLKLSHMKISVWLGTIFLVYEAIRICFQLREEIFYNIDICYSRNSALCKIRSYNLSCDIVHKTTNVRESCSCWTVYVCDCLNS